VEAEAESLTYKEEVVGQIVQMLRQKIGTDLMGIDIVIEKGSGRHAIIDINEFPGKNTLFGEFTNCRYFPIIYLYFYFLNIFEWKIFKVFCRHFRNHLSLFNWLYGKNILIFGKPATRTLSFINVLF